jgi:hypothetical protein
VLRRSTAEHARLAQATGRADDDLLESNPCIAGDLADRLISIWLPGQDRRRPVYRGVELIQTDPAWKDNLLFYEYFHGDNGAGLGAMHQTGWTALVADLLLDPPRRTRRMIFYEDEAARTPQESPLAAGPAG